VRFVLDTNILVRASVTGTGPARELLQRIVNSPAHTLLLSPLLLEELERVLSYERLRAVTKLSSDEVAEYFSYLRSKQISEIVFPGPAPRVVPADPTDDAVVHTAVIGKSRCFVYAEPSLLPQ